MYYFSFDDKVEQIQSSGEDLQDMRKNEDEEEEDGDKEEEEDDDDEEEDLTIPEQEIELDKGTITEEEKQAIPEFFEGRPSKTPERYLKIRNYILDQWYQTLFIYLFFKFINICTEEAGVNAFFQ